MHILRRIEVGLILVLCFPLLPQAQLVQEYSPSPAPCWSPGALSFLALELQDWNQLRRYHQDNLKLEAGGSVAGRVVFMGDSITDLWNLAKYFPGKPYVNRGISGQTSEQMMVRMYQDVINLHPSVAILLAGTNDIARVTGPKTLEMVEDNIRAMCDMAARSHINVILCCLTPVSDYTKSKQTGSRPPQDIVSLNQWLQGYAPSIHAQLADYYAATVDGQGMLRDGLSDDGLHPNARGYELMTPVAEAAIQAALKYKRENQ